MFFVGTVNCENKQDNKMDIEDDFAKKDKWLAPLLINGTVVTMILDAGAKTNLINMSDINAMRFKRNGSGLKHYNGPPINCLGTCRRSATVCSSL